MTPSIRSLYYGSPDDVFDHHFLFDLVTRCVRSRGSEEALAVYCQAIVAGFEHWGFRTVSLAELSDEVATGSALLNAIVRDESGDEREALTRLLKSRVALCDLALSWDSVLEGHPILTPFIRDHDEREIVAEVSSDIIEAGRKNLALAYDVDDRLARLYGNPEPTPMDLRALVGLVPAVAGMNALYDAEDFAIMSEV